jgi:catechol 2,3-dioxygenase-like lactoylglutathione lyase family enzyme
MSATQVARPDVGFTVMGLHHFAWRCRDAEETRKFYEDMLGLPLVHVIKNDRVPSTGEHNPHVHIFFQMGDGSYLAFFDLGDGTKPEPSPNTPAWVNHIAVQVADVEQLLRAKARVEASGVEVVGVTDHHIIQSIYFFDPNGLRVELTTKTAEDAEFAKAAANAHAALRVWAERQRA